MYTSQQIDPVEALKRQVDLSAYSFPQDSPRWLVVLMRYLAEDLGVLAVLGPSGLSIRTASRTDRVKPDSLALCLAALVSRSRKTGTRIALGLPPGARHLPLLLAAVSVLADALQRAQASAKGESLAGLSGVLVVSTDLDVRSRYCDLRVKDEALDNAFPGSRMRPTGEQVPLRPQPQNSIGRGVCFFLPPQDLPQASFRPALAILDLRYARLTRRAKEIANWACNLHQQTEVLAIYTLGDRDTREALANTQFKDLPVDHAALAACAELRPTLATNSTPVDWALIKKPIYLEREHEIITVNDAEIEAALVTARQMIGEQRSQESSGINRARWISATLSHMPVPLVWYEQSARNLGRSTLRRLADRLCVRYDTGMGATMQALKMQFDAILQHLQGRNPRAQKLLSLLPSLVEEAGNILILVRDRVFQRALQNWLDLEAFPNAPWLGKVQICPCPEYSSIALRSYPLVIINGTLPRRYRWIAGGALGDIVKFLAYPSEIDSITNQLEEVYSDSSIQRHAQQRERSLCGAATGASTGKSQSRSQFMPKLDLKTPQPPPRPANDERAPQFTSTVKDLRSLAQALDAAKALAQRAAEKTSEAENIRRAAWEDGAEEDLQGEDAAEAAEGAGHVDDIPCTRFEVQSRRRGHGFLWLPSEQTVECVRKSAPDEVSRIAASDLTKDDVLILVEEDARGSLFDRVVELAEDQPELGHLATYRKQWQEAMRVLAAKYDCARKGYWRIYTEFRAAGSTISTEISVRNWLLGRVMGPDRVSSIRAAGKLAAMAALERDAPEFDRAFRTIRAIHQGLGRRLSRAIRQSSHYLADQEDMTTTDGFGDYIWLPVNELLESIDLAEVLATSPEPKRISPQWVGRFLRSKST
jgi:hypothetical protein